MSLLALNEDEFMAQVTDLAEKHRWSWVHFRPARTAHGWATPVSGPLGKGWPDLVLVKPGRVIFAELKSDRGKLSAEQDDVIGLLNSAGSEAYVWRPKDFDAIVEILGAKVKPF